MTQQQAPYSTTGNVPVNIVQRDDWLDFMRLLYRITTEIRNWIARRYPEAVS